MAAATAAGLSHSRIRRPACFSWLISLIACAVIAEVIVRLSSVKPTRRARSQVTLIRRGKPAEYLKIFFSAPVSKVAAFHPPASSIRCVMYAQVSS